MSYCVVVGLFLSCHVSHKDQTQVVRLVSNCLYPASHPSSLSDPIFCVWVYRESILYGV